ncbi:MULTISPECIES: hypothetical protein [unclassified Pseudoalteromonas]|uniref:hypothetical protein n=1 Tax=unclassified Pseudoalteromonas TaxID=194690 RepID=UPI0005A96669|nr:MULTISPECIES: hypothetical protein [unclassified Pseudoalteromonas]
MTDKLENIKNEEIKLNKDGEIELSEELTNAIAGGFSPEDENEDEAINGSCPTLNGSCGKQLK